MTSAAAPEIERIFREHGAFVWRTVRRLGASESDADDLTQEVFLIVHRKLGEFEGRSSLTTWLYGIAVKVALAHRRRAHVRRELPTEEPPDTTLDAGPQDALLAAEQRSLLDRALSTLDDDKRAVFVLYELEELTMQDAALALDCPLKTAYSRLYAAREEVATFLRRHDRAEPALQMGGLR